MMTYRFTLIQKHLKENTHPSFIFISHHLRQYRNLDLDSRLFYIDLEPKFLSHLPTFQSEIIRAWMTSRDRMVTPPDSVSSVLNSPLNSTYINQFRDEIGGRCYRLKYKTVETSRTPQSETPWTAPPINKITRERTTE